LLGLFLDPTDEGLKVRSFSEQSAGKEAGIDEGDTLLEIDGKALTSYAALRMAMLESRPGQKVNVKVRHEGLFGRASDKTVEVTLK
jgi:S1-C subfamily serine protease